MQSLCNYKFEKIWKAYHKYQDDLMMLISLLEELDDQKGVKIAYRYVDDFNGRVLRKWLGQSIENVEHPKTQLPKKNLFADVQLESEGLDFTEILEV